MNNITFGFFSSQLKGISRTLADFENLNVSEEIKDEILLSKLKCKDAMASEALMSLNELSSNVLGFLSEDKLLCQHSFKQYLAFEEECTTHLTNYANKQFEQVVTTCDIFIQSGLC